MSDLETITIPRAEYNDLVARSKWLAYLEAAGVDNWQGMDFARELRNRDEYTGGEEQD